MDFAKKTTENEAENRTPMLKQPQGDPNIPKSCESRDGFSVDGNGISVKRSYIICKECAEKRERGEDPSAFHCCPYDSVVIKFNTEAGPISRPVPKSPTRV